jgi:hypothetical protein
VRTGKCRLLASALALVFGLAVAEGRPCAQRPAAPSGVLQSQREWKTFYPKFQRAIRKRDRTALKSMMAAEFVYSFGGNASRDEAIKHWDDAHVRGWEELSKVLTKGCTRPATSRSVSRNEQVISRLAPPAAGKDGYTDWRATFEFGKDRKWRLAAFVAGD